MGSKKGVKKRPTTERDRLYRLVLDLRKDGLSYNQIIERVEAETGVILRKSHISGWINGKHKPFGYVSAFYAKPSAELAYVIGVSLGDASTSSGHRNYNHMIKLRVIDEEFAKEFARCLGVLLGRTPPRVRWHEKTQSWHTELSSLLLMGFLQQDLKELVPIMSHCDDCRASFLRGFFDSEGSMSGRSLTAGNENLELLKLVCELLESLGIETTGTHLATKGGRTVLIKGKFYRQNEDLFYMRVRTGSLGRFREIVGFTIQRKSIALSRALGEKL
ncbi:MAG TPA: LAGLIDADG family homing endonuclease [Nitrososphaerales archaeon]|nr:LAGLIDADG family homing endonuclease [Nitrososphaerales archaeon]